MDWCSRFLRHCGGKPPEALSPTEVDAFLTHLAVDRGVVPSTQNVALNALVFLFREVLDKPLDDLKFSHARRRDRLPVVLTRDEVERVLACMEGTYGLIVGLLYGTGMRVMEGLRLRVGDLDFGHGSILIRDGKGSKDRVAPLPGRYAEPLRAHLDHVQALHVQDLKAGAGAVYLPHALVPVSSPTHRANGFGSMCSRAVSCRGTRARVRSAAIICTSHHWDAGSTGQQARQGSPSG